MTEKGPLVEAEAEGELVLAVVVVLVAVVVVLWTPRSQVSPLSLTGAAVTRRGMAVTRRVERSMIGMKAVTYVGVLITTVEQQPGGCLKTNEAKCNGCC